MSDTTKPITGKQQQDYYFVKVDPETASSCVCETDGEFCHKDSWATAWWTCSHSPDEQPVEFGPYCRKHFVYVYGKDAEKGISQ